MDAKKVEITIVVAIVGWLVSAGVRAVQVESKVSDHDSSIKIIADKIDKISNDVSFIKGTIEKKGE